MRAREVDPTRATVQRTALDGSGMATYATRFRNAIALAVNPATGTVWAGGAGQDTLPPGHPYEFIDALTSHPPVPITAGPTAKKTSTRTRLARIARTSSFRASNFRRIQR